MDNIAGDLTLHARWGYILTDADVTVTPYDGVITAYAYAGYCHSTPASLFPGHTRWDRSLLPLVSTMLF